MSGVLPRIDFDRLEAELRRDALRYAERWLPGGRKESARWVCGGVDGHAGKSFDLVIDGARVGQWRDHQTDEAGGTMIGLRAAQLGMSKRIDAARRIIDDEGLGHCILAPGEAPAAREAAKPAPARAAIIMPVPAEAPSYRLAIPWLGKEFSNHEVTAVYEYRAADGKLNFVVVRYDSPTAAKQIRSWCWTVAANGAARWAQRQVPAPRPLYGLDLLAASPIAPVLVVEGEKTAAAAQALLPDWVVVTAPCGVANASRADWSPLAGRRAWVWPDWDLPGRKVAVAVRAAGIQAQEIRVGTASAAIGWDIGPEIDPGEPEETRHGQDLADLPAALGDAFRAHMAALLQAPVEAPAAQAQAPRVARIDSYRDLVNAFDQHIKATGTRPDALAGWIDQAGHTAPTGDGEQILDFHHTLLLDGADPKSEHLKTATSVHLRNLRLQRRGEILSPWLGKPSTAAGKAALRAWVDAVCTQRATASTPAIPPAEWVYAAMAHFIWQVRRRMAGMGVEWDLMIVLVGDQGSGKTTAVDALSSTLAELSVPVTATQIVDPREAPILAQALIGRWDELAGGSKTESEALKRAVTQATIAFRRLYSQSYEIHKRSITFVGTSNLPLSMIIRDTSGARRFAELPASTIDWEGLAAIDLRAVWDCASELDDAPIKAHLHALRAHQSSIVHRDVVTGWQEWENSNGWRTIVMPRSDSLRPDVIPSLDGFGTDWHKENPGYADPGGWTTAHILQRIAYFGRATGTGKTGLAEQIDARLYQLGWQRRQVRVGKRDANLRERRWFLPDHLRAALSGPAEAASPATAAVEELRQQLTRAVAAESYEEAARLQSAIKSELAAQPQAAATSGRIEGGEFDAFAP